MAAGLSLEPDRLGEFRQRINESCELSHEDLIYKVKIDAVVSVFDTTEKTLHDISLMEPFGKGNSKPVFADKHLLVKQLSIIGKNKNTCKLKLERGGNTIDALLFHRGPELIEYLNNKYTSEAVEKTLQGKGTNLYIDITYDMSMNEFRGIVTPQVIINEYY